MRNKPIIIILIPQGR